MRYHILKAYILLAVTFVLSDNIGPFVSTAPSLVASDCNSPILLQRNPSVAYGGGQYLVVWSDGSTQPARNSSNIYCARISATTGAAIDPNGILVCNADNKQNNPRVAFDGSNFLVVWDDFRNGNDYDVYGARVSAAGEVLDPNGFAISKQTGINEAKPDVVFVGNQYMVVWMDARRPLVYGIFGSRVSTSGEVLDAGGIELVGESSSLIDSVSPPDFKWTGTSKYNQYDQWFEKLSSKSQPSLAYNGRKCVLSFVLARVNPQPRPANDFGLIEVNISTGRPVGAPDVWLGPTSSPNFKDRPAIVAYSGGFFVLAGLSHTSRGAGPSCLGVALYDTVNYRKVSFVSPQIQECQRETWKAAAFNGTHFITAMDYWVSNRAFELTSSAIAVNRYKAGDSTLVSPVTGTTSPGSLVESMTATEGRVRHCAMAAGPVGEVILVYEKDTGINNCRIVSRIITEN